MQAARRRRRRDPATHAGDPADRADRRLRAPPAGRRHRLPRRRVTRAARTWRRRSAASRTSTTRCDRSACTRRPFRASGSSPCCSGTTDRSSTSGWCGASCRSSASTRSATSCGSTPARSRSCCTRIADDPHKPQVRVVLDREGRKYLRPYDVEPLAEPDGRTLAVHAITGPVDPADARRRPAQPALSAGPGLLSWRHAPRTCPRPAPRSLPSPSRRCAGGTAEARRRARRGPDAQRLHRRLRGARWTKRTEASGRARGRASATRRIRT